MFGGAVVEQARELRPGGDLQATRRGRGLRRWKASSSRSAAYSATAGVATTRSERVAVAAFADDALGLLGEAEDLARRAREAANRPGV